MLVLERRVSEAIVIGDNITVTVKKIHKESVKLGIDAPREVSIHRKEIKNERGLIVDKFSVDFVRDRV